MPDHDNDMAPQLLRSLTAVIAVALVISGVLAALAYGGASALGLTGGQDDAHQGHNASAGPPPAAPSTRAAAPSPSAQSSPTAPRPSPHATAHATAPAAHRKHVTHRPKPHHRHAGHRRSSHVASRIQLATDRGHVGMYQQFLLSGRYAGGNGRTLAVQQFHAGSWQRFPVSVTVHGGRFSVHVASGRHGLNRFRLFDGAAGRFSNAVTVWVG